MSDNFFNFEREGLDFPFYKGNPKLTKSGWIFFINKCFTTTILSFCSLYCNT